MSLSESSQTTIRGIQNAAELIRNSQLITVLTGAGISTPSGIPDFRSPDKGLWNKLDPFEVASLTNFRYDPELFYKLMRPLATKLHDAEPNPAHIGLAQLENAGHVQTIITQNIDLLHQRAGSKHVLEVHGSFRSLTCISCYFKTDSESYIEPYLQNGRIPTCPKCKHVFKPDLILMGEQLPAQTWLKAVESSKNCNLMIIAGSSLEVLPVAGLPMRALENGAHLVIINHTPTYLDVRADVVIHEGVETIIPGIVEEVIGGHV
jgi:NAD-dependent deacetylase